jgi:DUF917 family protein
MRELTHDDALDAISGGSVLACGGGGWVWHGELMGDLATRVGRPVLVTADELPDDALIATVTAIGAPASPNWEIRPLDYVRALELLIEAVGRPVDAVMTAQNGSSTTLNGWIQSAVLGVKVLDAAGDVRAHPTGKLGSMGLTERPGYQTVQVLYGGNRTLHGETSVVARGTVTTTANVLRDACVRGGGFMASARNPVDMGWVRANAALGAVSYALRLGRAMRTAAPAGGAAVIDAVCDTTKGEVLGTGVIEQLRPVTTSGGFDHGTFKVGDLTIPFLNEYMAVERDGTRLATFPDVIALLNTATGTIVSIADVAAATTPVEAAVVAVDRAHLPLSSGVTDRSALAEVEAIMGIALRG